MPPQETSSDNSSDTLKNSVEKEKCKSVLQMLPQLLYLLLTFIAAGVVALLALCMIIVHFLGSFTPFYTQMQQNAKFTVDNQTVKLSHHANVMRQSSLTLACLSFTAAICAFYISVLQLYLALKALKVSEHTTAESRRMCVREVQEDLTNASFQHRLSSAQSRNVLTFHLCCDVICQRPHAASG